jgi:hypothetical protein
VMGNHDVVAAGAHEHLPANDLVHLVVLDQQRAQSSQRLTGYPAAIGERERGRGLVCTSRGERWASEREHDRGQQELARTR